MSNKYDVILRCTNDNGVKFDLDLVDVPELPIDISAIELGDIGKVFGISSQTFTLPGNDNNNKFFNNVFDLGATPAVALNKSVPCQVLVDGEAVFTGKLYIQDIVSDQYNDVIYNVVVTNEVVDFKILTEDVGLSDLNWSPYSHSYTYASISQSWNDQLFSGSILYPLVNYGANPLDSTSPQFEFGGATYQMDNPRTPLKVSQFKPAVQVKTIVDEIFKSINYKYTSSFMDSTFFKNLYMLSSAGDDKDGLSFSTSNSGSYVWTSAAQTITSGFTTLPFGRLVFNNAVYNNGDNFDLTNDYYVADYTGEHIFNVNIPFTITSAFGPLQQTVQGRQCVIKFTKNGTLVNEIHTSKTPLTSATSGVVNTGNVALSLAAGDIIRIYFALQTPPANGLETFTTVTTAGQNGVWVKVTTPQNPIGGTVDVSKTFGDLNTLDFMKGLIQKFNLVIEPLENNPNILKIEPYNDWVEQGETVDWTDKFDRSVKYKIEHPITQLPARYRFSDDLDDDVLNQYTNTTIKKTYGEYVYNTDSDLAEGEEEIGGFFAATPVKQLPTKGGNGTTVVPWLVKQEPGKYVQPYNFKPRLLHKTPIKTIPNNEMAGTATGSFSVPTGSTFYYIDDPQNSGVRALNFYRTLLPTTDSPTDFTSSLDLHYANLGYYPFQQSSVNGQCQDGLFNRYWAYYINSLYDIDARLLTCNILLKPSDLKDIKLNNKYFIDGHLYRINRISAANLVQEKSTEVQFVKILARKQPFTGRRRVSTGLNPEDFEDIITDGFDTGGNVRYVKYDDGTPVTNPNILGQVSVLDGWKAYGSEVSWNTPNVSLVNPNVFVLGNSKYNETQNNVAIFGPGNVIPDSLSNSFLFGSNITINSTVSASNADTGSAIGLSATPFNNISVFANDANITDSTNVVLIQPSGTRNISGSQNNVLINPINDISETSPTGSVYTGNLRNQGTADFAQGLTATGSVDITGSLFLNGSAITPGGGGSTNTGSLLVTASYSYPNLTFTKGDASTFSVQIQSGSTNAATQFNKAFANDPTNEVFATIPQVVGRDRTFQIEYQLTSGSATAINGGLLQITGDGTSTVSVDVINRRVFGGAPTASFTAVYSGADVNVRATFVGQNYIISGSFVPYDSMYGQIGPTGPAGPSGSVNTASLATTGSNTFKGNQVVTGSITVTGSIQQNDGYLVLAKVSQSLDFPDDIQAAAGGVPLGGIYRSGNFIFIRMT